MPSAVIVEHSAAQPPNQNRPGVHDALLPRHPLSRLSGELTPSERNREVDALRRREVPVEVETLDGQVVYDWHRYEVAFALGKPIICNPVEHHDPPGYLISRLLGKRALNRGQCAAIEVTLRLWQPTGRPKNPTTNADFTWNVASTMTTRAMAEEADVSETYIRMAKRVHRKGGDEAIRQVVLGRSSLKAADVMLSDRGQRKGDAATARVSGDAKPAAVATLAPASPRGDPAGDDADELTGSLWVGLAMLLVVENRRLKRANQGLENENRLLNSMTPSGCA